MAGKRRKKIWITAGLAVILFGASSVYYFQYAKGSKDSSAEEVTYTVKKGSIRSSVTGTSQLEPKDMQTITSPADGVIKAINLSKTKNVKAGDLLVEISSPALEANLQKALVTLSTQTKDLNDTLNQMNAMKTKAPISGKLTLATNIDTGSTVTKTTKIGSVSDINNLLVTLPFYFDDASQLVPGDVVDLTIDGFMLSKTGVVKSVGKDAHGDSKGGKLLDVDVSVSNDGSMDAGLIAKGSVVKGKRTIESQSSGTFQYSRIISILSNVAGYIDSMNVKTNTLVKEGDIICSIANDTIKDDLATKQNNVDQQNINVQDLQDKVNALKVKAPFEGVFSTDFVNKKTNILTTLTPGTKVSTTTQFGGVASMENMQLPIQVDELDLTSVKTGMKAVVKVDSVSGKVFEAEVSQVSTVGTTTNGVTFFDVVLAVKNTSTLKYGMTATGEILFQDKQDVLVIPVEALQQSKGKQYVSMKKADGTVENQHEIKVGIRSKTQLEVTDGLKEGDVIVLPQLQKQQKMTQAEIDKMRQQFQNSAGQGQGQGPGQGVQMVPSGAAGTGGAGNAGTGGNAGGGNARNSGGK